LRHGTPEGADFMADRSGAGAPLTARWLLRRPPVRRDRRRRQTGPVVEALEGRLLQAGTSPANSVPIGSETSGPQLGAAYQQVVAIQTATLQALGDSYREVQAAGARLASQTAVAIDELNAELGQVKGQQQADAIAAAIRRDRNLLDLGGASVAREEQGLDVARGIADQQAITDKADIPNRLFTTLTELVGQDQSTNAAISRSGRRSANALIRKLDGLGDQLTEISA
jgi:hypothetical protein